MGVFDRGIVSFVRRNHLKITRTGVYLENKTLTPSRPPENDPGHVYARPARTGQRGLRETRALATDCPVHVRVRSWCRLVVVTAENFSPWPIS